MNIQEYISSGILEAYALGELLPAERKEVEKYLSDYPDLRDELGRIELTQEKLLMSVGLKPSVSIRNKLINNIPESQSKIIAMPSRESAPIWKYSLAASVALMLVSSFLAWNYYSKWKQTESSLADLISQNQRIAQDFNSVNQRLDKIETDVKVINNPAFKRTIMSGTANAPQSLAYVYWNENTKEVFLSIQNLKELTQESQYQLWAIVEGKPVDVGVFDGNIASLLKMKDISGAAAFAVTIEPRGGKASPTLETMQVVGSVLKG